MTWPLIPLTRAKQLVLDAVHGETRLHRELAGSTLVIQLDNLHSEIEYLRSLVARMEKRQVAP